MSRIPVIRTALCRDFGLADPTAKLSGGDGEQPDASGSKSTSSSARKRISSFRIPANQDLRITVKQLPQLSRVSAVAPERHDIDFCPLRKLADYSCLEASADQPVDFSPDLVDTVWQCDRSAAGTTSTINQQALAGGGRHVMNTEGLASPAEDPREPVVVRNVTESAIHATGPDGGPEQERVPLFCQETRSSSDLMHSRDRRFLSGADQPPSIEIESFSQGTVVGGKYRVVALLGRGGMGAVYRVEQVFLKREFALKTLDSCRIAKNALDVLVRRFQIEARAASALNHPYLVQVHDFGLLDNGYPYLVMDLVEGCSLSDYLKQRGPLQLHEADSIFTKVCLGLAYAHEQGVIHRDIKPSNIMLVGPGSAKQSSIKVVDFGIAKLVGEQDGDQSLTRTGEIFGSPLYMSPEQCSGNIVDHRSDIYSLGCVLFEALTGTPPHIGPNVLRTMMLHQTESAPLLSEASLGRKFPAALESVLSGMLRKSPMDRYQDLHAVARDLAAACAGHSVNSPSSNLPPYSASRYKLHALQALQPNPLFLIAVVIALGTAVAAASRLPLCNLVSGTILPSERNGQTSQERRTDHASPTDDLEDLKKLTREGYYIDSLRLARTIASFDKVKRIGSSTIFLNGTKWRRFVFPDSEIGTVSTFAQEQFATGATLPTHWEARARGEVLAPPNQPLTLYVNAQADLAQDSLDDTNVDWLQEFVVLAFPSVFDKIDPAEFQALYIQPSSVFSVTPGATELPNTNGAEAGKWRMYQSEGVAHILRAAARWTKLETVGLFGVETEEQVLTLNNLRQLKNLFIRGPRFGAPVIAAAIARQPFLHRLEQIRLKKMPVDPILVRFAGSDKLNTLVLEECSVSSTSIRALATCPHLKTLEIRPPNDCADGISSQAKDDLIDAIAKIECDTMYLARTRLTNKQISALLHGQPHRIILSADSNKDQVTFVESLNNRKISFVPF